MSGSNNRRPARQEKVARNEGAARKKPADAKSKWPMVRLGELLSERRESPDEERVLCGQIGVVDKISFESGEITLRADGETKMKLILARPGDLLVSGINAAKGAIAIVDGSGDKPIAATIHYGAYVPKNDQVDIWFLWWLLRSRYFRELLAEQVPGGIKTELKATRLLPIQVPLPPLSEQRRIVRRIDAITHHIVRAIAVANAASTETDGIAAEFADPRLQDFRQRYGTRPLDGLILTAGYGTSVKCITERREGMVPVIRIPNVLSERVTFAKLKYAEVPKGADQISFLSLGDILVVRTNGSKDLVGRCAVVSNLPEPSAFASYLIRIRCDSSCAMPKYVQQVLRQLRRSRTLFDAARTTAGQYNISLKRLQTVEIPAAPLEHQETFVREMDELESQTDRLRKMQNQVASELDALLPSILDRAFKGEL